MTGAGTVDRAALVVGFRTMLERVGGRCDVVADEAAAGRVLLEEVRRLGASRVAVSDGPLARRLAAGLPDEVERLEDPGDRERLLACDLGLSEAQHAIAETGTLVLVSSEERHRLVSLVPPVHVAVLSVARMLARLEDGLAAVAVPGGPAAMPRCVTFITGPSRTGDIELVLVVGVHGPRELYVILIDEEES